MSTSISDLTSYDPWFMQMSSDASAATTPDMAGNTGSPTIAANGTLGGDPSSLLSHLTDVMQTILAQYQEAAGAKASVPAADHSTAAAMPNDEMLTELITDLNSELSTLESGSSTGMEAAPLPADTTTPNSTARLAEALSNMAMLMLQSYGTAAPAAGASVRMTG